MAVSRFASGKPAVDEDLLLYTVERTALTSIVAVNVGGTTEFSAWIVPSGEDENPDNWIYYVDRVPLTNRNSFETFKIAVNVNDKIYVSSLSGDVTFFINGIYDIAGRANITASEQAPESPQVGDIWIDTTDVPPVNKYWTGSAWVETGSEGPTGPANNLTIGTVSSVDSNGIASASITGSTPNQILNFTLKQGPTGPQGTFDVFENAPTGPDQGDVWWNSQDGRFYVYYDDYWVEALSNEAGPTGPRGPAGPAGADGIDGVNPTISVTGPLTVTGPTESRLIGINVGTTGGVQAWDPDLDSIAALATPTLPAFLRESASGVWSLDTTAYAPLTGATFTGTVTGAAASFTGAVSALSFSTTGPVSALNYNVSVQTALASTGTVNLDFLTQGFKSHSTLTGNIVYTASNYTAGRTLTIRVVNGTTLRNLTFPTNWVFLGARPTSIAASKTGILTVTSFGTTEADCVAAWAVQP